MIDKLNFTRETLLNLIRELIWLTITGMFVYGVLYPITSRLYYKHTVINSLFVVVTVTYFRYFISFNGLAFFKPKWLRFVVFALNFELFFYIMREEQLFLRMIDDFTMQEVGFPKVIMFPEVIQSIFKYVRLETTFFGTGALVMIVLFQFRIILSYWKVAKHRFSDMMQS